MKKFDWARNTDRPGFGFHPDRDVDPAFDKLVVPVPVPAPVPAPRPPPMINPNYTPLPTVVSAPPRPPSLFASLALTQQPMQVDDDEKEDDDDDDTDLLRDLDLVEVDKNKQDIAWANRFDIIVQLGRLDGQDMYTFACHPENSSIEDKHLMVLQKMCCVMREDLFRVVTCPLITPNRDSVRFPARFWSLVSGLAWQISRLLSSTPSRFLRTGTAAPPSSLARIQDQMQNTYLSQGKKMDSLMDHPLALTRLLIAAHWLISPAQLQDVILDARQRCRLANPLMWAVLPDDQKPDPAFLVLFRVIVGPMLYTAMNSAAFEPPIPKAAMDELTTKLDLKSWPLENNVVEQRADGSLSRVSLFGPTMLNKTGTETREWFWRLLLLHQFCPPI